MSVGVNMMSVGIRTRSVGYKVGWWVLVVIAGASVVSHISLAGFAEEDAWVLAFFGLAAMNIYALVVLLTGYRRGERWAWWVTWVLVAIYALVIFYAHDAGPYYLGAAAVMAIAQLLTWSGFRDLAQ
ncbi:MAG TPA: hypothetical protein VFT54_05400 [Acidimicrobiia bacterium]|nr:hypothetical protein [Acidimicrobiia bacterium]